MSWLGSPLPGGTMWSIVQSRPSRCLPHPAQIGSSTVLAYALALRHSGVSCQSLIVVEILEAVEVLHSGYCVNGLEHDRWDDDEPDDD